MTTPSDRNLLRVWDLPTRWFHWSLVLMMVGMIITGNLGADWMIWHAQIAYVMMGSLVFRLIWGFVGGWWSRFAQFFPTPSRIRAYWSGAERPGHNPLGALSIFAVFFLLSLQLGTGLMATDDISFYGPLNASVSEDLASAVTQWHKSLGKLLLILWVVLHVAAILWHRWRRHHDLITPMITGDAPVSQAHPPSADHWRNRLAALVLWLLCVGVSCAIWVPLTS